MSILDAVLKVLTEEKRPMSAEELTKHIVGKNLWIPETKTPVASVGAALYSDIKKNGAKSKFVKAGNGYFSLAADVSREEDNAGFVYILTHRCFKDGIVKIGRTKGEVEKRNKELFSTELPWPFDTYATLKTSRFVETEKLIHYFLDAKRINPKREFFSISPEKALEIFYRVREVLPDCEIFDDYKREKVYEEDDKQVGPKIDGMTAGEKAILAFWTEFNKYVKNKAEFLAEFSLRKAHKYCFYDFAIKRPRYHVLMRVTTRKGNILSGLYFSGDKKSYDSFLSNHDDVEKFIGEPLDWVWAKKDGAFSAVKKFDINGPKSTWPDAFDWLCKMAIKFKRLDEKFGPHAEL